jgi:hypothetical protein
MEPVDENKTDLNKKLLDDKQSANDSFFCVNFFQYMTSCCFLLYA